MPTLAVSFFSFFLFWLSLGFGLAQHRTEGWGFWGQRQQVVSSLCPVHSRFSLRIQKAPVSVTLPFLSPGSHHRLGASAAPAQEEAGGRGQPGQTPGRGELAPLPLSLLSWPVILSQEDSPPYPQPLFSGSVCLPSPAPLAFIVSLLSP